MWIRKMHRMRVCALHCPVGAARDQFNADLGCRPSIYIEYPQAVPLAYIIDRETCVDAGCARLCAWHRL